MNRLRIFFFSLLVLALVAGALPVTESLAKWSRRAAVGSHNKNKRHRRHSRAWWRRHRARVRARRERAAELRRQRLEAGQSALSGGNAFAESNPHASASSASIASPNGGGLAASSAVHSAQMPFGFDVPHTWTPVRGSRIGGAVFSVRTPDGRAVGTAVVAPVSMSASLLAGTPSNGRTKSVGGMPVTALRRTVIDKMVAEGGWVTNDLVQEMQGRRVFVVIAQTGAPGAPAKSWAFYFTEIDGHVYSLATTTPVEFAEPVALGSRQFMASLRSSGSINAASRK
jgi:hypothetical protein